MLGSKPSSRMEVWWECLWKVTAGTSAAVHSALLENLFRVLGWVVWGSHIVAVRISGPSISLLYLFSFSSSFLFPCLFLDEGLSVQPRLPRNWLCSPGWTQIPKIVPMSHHTQPLHTFLVIYLWLSSWSSACLYHTVYFSSCLLYLYMFREWLSQFLDLVGISWYKYDTMWVRGHLLLALLTRGLTPSNAEIS